MPIHLEHFDQTKIDRLKKYLVSMAGKHTAKFYEIFVDTLKIVPKTNNPDLFDRYEHAMTPDTNQVKIVIYNTGRSPRNDQYVFSMKAKNHEEAVFHGLNGLPARKTYSKNSLYEMRDEFEQKLRTEKELVRLRQEVQELNEELDEKVGYIGELEAKVNEAKANNNKLGGIDISEILSGTFESLIRRNTHVLAQIPAAKGLAGIIEQDNRRMGMQKVEPETEVSFKKKGEESAAPALSEQEQECIRVFTELNKYFSPDELTQVFGILDCLSRDKSRLPLIIDTLGKQ